MFEELEIIFMTVVLAISAMCAATTAQGAEDPPATPAVVVQTFQGTQAR